MVMTHLGCGLRGVQANSIQGLVSRQVWHLASVVAGRQSVSDAWLQVEVAG